MSIKAGAHDAHTKEEAAQQPCCVEPLLCLPTSAHLAIRPELKLQELVSVFARVAYIVPQVELVCHGAADAVCVCAGGGSASKAAPRKRGASNHQL